MTSLEKFLNLLEQKDLVPEEVLQGLRRQAAASAKPIRAETAAKYLVQAGHLTANQAQRLLQQVRESLGPAAGKEKEAPPGPKTPAAPPTPPAAEKGTHPGGPPSETAPPEPPASTGGLTSLLEEELGLAPLEEEKPRRLIQPTPSAGPSESPATPPGPSGAKPAAQAPPGPKPPSRPADRPLGKAPRPSESARKESKQPTPSTQEKKPAEAEGTKKKAAAPSAKAPAESPPALASLLEEELGALEAPGAGPADWDALLAASAVGSAGPLEPLAPAAAKRSLWRRWFSRQPRPRARGWDSPLILVGSGLLLILIFVGMVLILVLRRESGDALLEAAHADFAQGSYTQAIFKYNQFLERFGGHPGASLARVRRGTAQIRQAVEEGRDWPKALQTAEQVLAEIASEDQFREAHAELASLLPTIAKGLADAAQKHPDPAALPLAEQTLALVDRYVPRSLQNQGELDEIRASLAVSARRLNQQAEIEKTVSAIQEALRKEKPDEGYRLASSLLRQYPEAAGQEKLTQTLQDLKDSFQKQLHRPERNRPAETEEPPGPFTAEIALAGATGQPIPAAQAEVVVIGLGGCVYALEASSGKLLWRRWTGPVSNGRTVEAQPLPVSADPTSDLIVVGADRKELWRLERATGRLRWRNRLPGPIQAPPVLARNHVLVLSEAGAGRTQLEWLDLQTGAAQLAVDLPQKVDVAPAVDLRRDRIYLIADHSYLWILSLQDGQCLEVVSIGHAPGAITAPPLPLADWLLLAENHRLDQSLLKLLEVGQPRKTGSRIIFQEEAPGHVDLPPVAADRRLVVLTDRGAIRVYEIQPAGGKLPLARTAERGPEGPINVIRFPLLLDQDLWVAGHELARFAVQTAQGRLEFRPPENPETGDIFLRPPLALEKTVVHVRYRPAAPGVWVAAVDRQTGKRQWQTLLAVPPVRQPMHPSESPGKVWLVNQAGQVFDVELAGAAGRQAVSAPMVSLESALTAPAPEEGPQRTLECTRLPDRTLLCSFGPGADRWFVLEKKNGVWQWTNVSFGGTLAHGPTPFADGLLVPTQAGRIELRDARTGRELLAPFQPPLEPGRIPTWGPPAVIPPPNAKTPSADTNSPKEKPADPNSPTEGSPEFLVSDGLGRVYRVGMEQRPKPHLKALAWVDLPGRPVSPIAVVGQTAWLVEETPPSEPRPPSHTADSPPPAGSSQPSKGRQASATSGEPESSKPGGRTWRLIYLRLPQLERKEAARLNGRCVLGPVGVGEWMYLATDAGETLLADAQGQRTANLRTQPDPPAGLPLSWRGGLLAATQTGQLLWLRPEPDTWKINCFLQLGRPVASGPMVYEDQLILLAHDGAVYVLKPPASEVPPGRQSASPESSSGAAKSEKKSLPVASTSAPESPTASPPPPEESKKLPPEPSPGRPDPPSPKPDQNREVSKQESAP